MKIIKLLFLLLVTSELLMLPAMAANETSFNQISDTTLNDLTFVNQTALLKWPNGTVAYTVDYPPLVVQTVPLGLDLQIQMQIVQTFFIIVIALIMIVRATYDLMAWIYARRKL